MILIDTNLLLYAYNQSAPYHKTARSWVEGVMSESPFLRATWVSILAFLRISTHGRLFPTPLSIKQSSSIVNEWFEQPEFGVLEPGPRY